MTLDQENHLAEIQQSISKRVNEKYRAGQSEHGGDLWERVPLVEDLIEEALDQMTYALTLKSQLGRVKKLLDDARNAAPENPVSAQKLITRAMTYL
jgi:hypothetical protein|tara:strand:- start:929 stop:1216 length:288 start_codon:yes stop_codon:yes gene_type:complete